MEHWSFNLAVWSSLWFFCKLFHLSGVNKILVKVGLREKWRSVFIVKYHPLKFLLPSSSFYSIDLKEGRHGHPDLLSIFKGHFVVNGKKKHNYIGQVIILSSRISSWFWTWGYIITYRVKTLGELHKACNFSILATWCSVLLGVCFIMWNLIIFWLIENTWCVCVCGLIITNCIARCRASEFTYESKQHQFLYYTTIKVRLYAAWEIFFCQSSFLTLKMSRQS